jgi:hypothetical protein
VRNDVSYAAAGAIHVANAAWDHMDVEMRDGLAGSFALVKSDIETIGTDPLGDQGLSATDAIQHRRLLRRL